MVFIAGFLDWFDAGPVSPNAFDFTFTGLIPWLLLARRRRARLPRSPVS